MDIFDKTSYKYVSLSKAKILTWLFLGWPEGDLRLKLHLSVGQDLSGKPAIIVNLHRSHIPKEITLSPLYCEPVVGMGKRMRIGQRNEGLVAIIQNGQDQSDSADFLLFQPHTFLLFEAHGSIIEGFAMLEVGPRSTEPYFKQYAGVINFDLLSSW